MYIRLGESGFLFNNEYSTCHVYEAEPPKNKPDDEKTPSKSQFHEYRRLMRIKGRYIIPRWKILKLKKRDTHEFVSRKDY